MKKFQGSGFNYYTRPHVKGITSARKWQHVRTLKGITHRRDGLDTRRKYCSTQTFLD